jgi:hypothetical protein
VERLLDHPIIVRQVPAYIVKHFPLLYSEINGIDAGGETAHGSEEYQARLMTLEPPELIPSNFLT